MAEEGSSECDACYGKGERFAMEGYDGEDDGPEDYTEVPCLKCGGTGGASEGRSIQAGGSGGGHCTSSATDSRTTAGTASRSVTSSVAAYDSAEGAGAATSAGAPARKRCTLPAATVVERLGRHAEEDESLPCYIRQFLGEPFLASFLEDEMLRSLLANRRRVKEVAEAYSSSVRVLDLLRELRCGRGYGGAAPPQNASKDGGAGGGEGGDGDIDGDGDGDGDRDGGQGVVVIDVCSGKGFAATLLSFLLPKATIIMMDANGDMDLSHVAARPNLTFCHADIFSAEAACTIRDAARGSKACVLTGVHLCGSLSPRLIDLALGLDDVRGMVLCPCCLKGGLGRECLRVAKAAKADQKKRRKTKGKKGETDGEMGVEGEEAGGAGVASPGKEEDPYKVLVEVLREKCEQELSASAAGRGEGKENEGKDDCTGDEKTREEGGDETETEKGSGAAGGGKGESILGRAADHYVGMGGRVEVSFDVAMRSPKNGMITLLKT